jgi:outer membrane protein TolC
VAACTSLGPKAETPVSLAPTGAGNAEIEPVDPASGEPQHFTQGAKVPTQWWKGFGNADLDALVDQALKANNDLAAADAALRQARRWPARRRAIACLRSMSATMPSARRCPM